jgi:hypothetical protein
VIHGRNDLGSVTRRKYGDIVGSAGASLGKEHSSVIDGVKGTSVVARGELGPNWYVSSGPKLEVRWD